MASGPSPAARSSSATSSATRTSTRRCGRHSRTLDHRPPAGGNVRRHVSHQAPSDRYDPLPGLTEIPAWLIRKLSPRGRKIAGVIAALALVGAAVALYFAIPAITETKQERAEAKRRAGQQREADLVAKLKGEQRLVEGQGTAAKGLTGKAAI